MAVVSVSALREPRRSFNPRGQDSPLPGLLLLLPSTNQQRFAIGLAFLVGVLCGRLGSPSACWTSGAAAAIGTSISTISTIDISTNNDNNNDNNNDHNNDRTTTLPKSSVTNLADVLFRATSHKDKATGLSIQKQQLIEPFVVPNLAGVSVGTLQPRQTVELHDHRSMHEFFYVLEGSGEFFVCGNGNRNSKNKNSKNKNKNNRYDDGNDDGNGDSHTTGGEWHRGVPGTLVHVLPHCAHSITAPETNSEPLKMLVVGVTVGD